MSPAADRWLEAGLRWVHQYLFDQLVVPSCGAATSPAVNALLPVTRALFRWWGARDPSRALGAAATLEPAALRAVARAAAVEFASWPTRACAAVLRRAELDLLSTRPADDEERDRLAEFCELIGEAWARRQPDELEAFYERTAQPLGVQGGGLWLQRLHRAAETGSAAPPPGLLPPGDPTDWLRAARWALSPITRIRACLALAVADD